MHGLECSHGQEVSRQLCRSVRTTDGLETSGEGHDLLVSEVANTTLKEPRVGKAIPTVAKLTQGEVIKFAGAAAEAMRADGMNVLMEGHASELIKVLVSV